MSCHRGLSTCSSSSSPSLILSVKKKKKEPVPSSQVALTFYRPGCNNNNHHQKTFRIASNVCVCVCGARPIRSTASLGPSFRKWSCTFRSFNRFFSYPHLHIDTNTRTHSCGDSGLSPIDFNRIYFEILIQIRLYYANNNFFFFFFFLNGRFYGCYR